MALGASPRDIILKVTGEGFLLAAAGVPLGIRLTLPLTPLLRAELYGTTLIDPGTLLEVALTLMSVALLASAVPAFRACKISPAVAFQQR